MNKVNYYLINTLLLALLICSCSDLDQKGCIDDANLTFTLDIPSVTEVSRSYNDNSVRNLDLLVFNSSDQFVERIRVNAISGTGPTKTFSARLSASTTQRTVHIIANARGGDNSDIVDFSHITSGTSLSAAITGLTSEVLSAGQSPELPLLMWGRVVLPSITSWTVISAPVSMLRATASMYVTCDTPTPANGLSDFTLTGFSIVSASDRGRVAPSGYNAGASTPATPTMPPVVNRINYATDAHPVWAESSTGTTSELYVYEKTNTGNQNTDLKIIIRGSWKGTEGYYPVWMSDGTANTINVVRNHRYRVTIKGVYGTGYATLPEAINAIPASSLILTDTNDDITDIITDGQYKLGVSSNMVTLAGSGTKTVATVMKTNASHTLTGTSGESWITGISFVPSGTERWALSANFGSTTAIRSATITVRAGSLTRTIEVVQRP